MLLVFVGIADEKRCAHQAQEECNVVSSLSSRRN
nr:MAG TPA: hypothetical protein [Caudoviricetes sp.]DAZ50076.1 MAG TPA: hypothetical protein [Caudoviricetes sp.]